MRIVVIGGSGHIGTFLIPRLVRAGHEVVSITRGTSTPYVQAPEWSQVEHVVADREAEDRAGTFGDRVAALQADAVIDLVCFTVESARKIVESLRPTGTHLIHCGSIWRAGPAHVLPVTEENATPPIGEYGVAKDAIARLLTEETASGGLDTTSLHPGHISGPGWIPIGPTGNADLQVWRTIAAGEPLVMPGLGAESMAHVHADDVAQGFQLAAENRAAAAGEDFFLTAADALTARGYARIGASWFGRDIEIRSVSWEEFRDGVSEADGNASWEHLMRGHVISVEKARRILGYEPRWSAAETVREAVAQLIDDGRLQGVPGISA